MHPWNNSYLRGKLLDGASFTIHQRAKAWRKTNNSLNIAE
jgi:hypothetical protein